MPPNSPLRHSSTKFRKRKQKKILKIKKKKFENKTIITTQHTHTQIKQQTDETPSQNTRSNKRKFEQTLDDDNTDNHIIDKNDKKINSQTVQHTQKDNETKDDKLMSATLQQKKRMLFCFFLLFF